MKAPAWILGFHGCDRTVADRVLVGEDEIRPSENDYDWLGTGAYFWENNVARALSWAKFLASSIHRGDPKVKEPAVIGTIIDPGNCLDLTEKSSIELVGGAYEGLRRFYEVNNVPLPANESAGQGDLDFVKRFLDCAVINFLHETREAGNLEAFDTVRAPFLEGGPLYPGAKISSRTHVQWCVRNPKNSIVGYFRPRGFDVE
jgi:hypothetical protein